MKLLSLPAVVALMLTVSPARADDAALARAICYSAALGAESVADDEATTYCTDVTSLGQAECLKGALHASWIDGEGDTFSKNAKSYCKKAKTRAEGICVAAALGSKSVKEKTEITFCQGVSEAEANCLVGAFGSEQAEAGKERDFCKSFSFASEHAAQNTTTDPLSLCQAKLDDLSELFSRVSPSWFNRSLKQLKESASQILDHTDNPPPAGAAQTN